MLLQSRSDGLKDHESVINPLRPSVASNNNGRGIMTDTTTHIQSRTDKRRRIVFREDLRERWGIKANASTLWRKELQGKFPKHFIYCGRNAWYEDVIDAHVNALGDATTEAA
jgi:hypothetical protein